MIAFSDDNERRRDSERKRQTRAKERDIEIRKCANRARRNRALADVYVFLDLYFGHRFYNPLTQMHRDMVQAILYRATHGGDQAIAAPRGEGKTTIAECVIIYCILAGLLKFPLIVAATGPDATRILDNIKHEFETNELLGGDFPEVCDPIIALEGGTARQNMQTVGGERTRLKWSTDLIVFPAMPKKYKSPCCGTVLMTRGLDAAIRGIRHHGQRPDFVLIDDPETRESAASEHQIKTREETLDRDIGGLAGQGKKIARVTLCTTQNRFCLAFRLTDPTIKPSHAGRRYRLLEKWPDRLDLRDEYVALRKACGADGDIDAKKANDWYAEHIADIENGGVASNQNSYVRELELSAIHHCYNFIADKGMPAFMAEYQNDPLDEDELNPDQISSNLVGKRITGLEHRELPADFLKLVSFVDIGERNFNWTDTAWADGCIGSVLDYGLTDVKAGEFNPQTHTRDPKTLELAVISALHEWRTELLAKYKADEQSIPVSMALIDSGSGLHTKAVYKFCREVGAPFYPSKGMPETWSMPQLGNLPGQAIKRGDRWALVKQKDGINVYHFDSSYWKKFCHERFLTETFDANQQRSVGSLGLFVCPELAQFQTDRREFTHQMVGQVWGVKKMGGKPCWIPRGSGKDHFLDSTAGTCLGANIVGVKLVADIKKAVPKLSLAELAAAAKRG